MARSYLTGCVAAGLMVFAALGEPFDVGEAFKDEAFWKSDPVLFVKKHRDAGFKLTSEDCKTADSRLNGGVTCFGLEVYETRVSFAEKEGVTRVEVALFNRGGTESVEEVDLGSGKRLRHLKHVEKAMAREEFLAIVEKVRTRLTPTGAKKTKPALERPKGTDIRQYEQTWAKTTLSHPATLTWNYEQGAKKSDPFSAGFIRLVVEDESSDNRPSGRAKAGARGGAKLTDNLVKDSRGDVFIDNVPMVDQGAKGYCAAATAERVLKYYGLDVDEHEVAVAAKTSAEGGTSTAEMVKSVTAIGKQHQLATTVLYGSADKGSEERIANLTKEVVQYNKVAKRLKKPQIAESVYVRRSGNTIYYSPGAVDEAMDAEVLREIKVKGVEKPKYMTFMKNVRQNVNVGQPLIWGVKLGLYPESDLPQTGGRHMRLIIGYNDKKGEILYTDSWGKGHELKRMPADWAWTITHSLLVMRSLRR